MSNGGLPTQTLAPVVSFELLDDPPAFTGDPNGDPFVVGQLANAIPNAFVTGHAFARVAQNPFDDDTPGSSIVNTHQTFVIDVYWDLNGPLISAFCGNWAVTITFESMGPDNFDFQLVAPDPGVPFGCNQPDNPDRNSRIYHASFTVPQDSVQVDLQRGTTYELNVTLALLAQCDNLPSGIVGFIALEDILFFSA